MIHSDFLVCFVVWFLHAFALFVGLVVVFVCSLIDHSLVKCPLLFGCLPTIS